MHARTWCLCGSTAHFGSLKVFGKTASLSTTPQGKKPGPGAESLVAHPEVRLPFTPTYFPWLNQIEIRFARIECEMIARGVFASAKNLARKPLRYIQAYSKGARPFQWKYLDVTKLNQAMLTNSLVAVGITTADRLPAQIRTCAANAEHF
jgi:hypothetical protein